jgi:hypothetical protein
MPNNVACIKNASLDAHTDTRMIHFDTLKSGRDLGPKPMKSLIMRGDWCLGPESNRHARLLVTQDFKSCTFSSQHIVMIGIPLLITTKNASIMRHLKFTHAPLCSSFTFLLFKNDLLNSSRGAHGKTDLWSKL